MATQSPESLPRCYSTYQTTTPPLSSRSIAASGDTCLIFQRDFDSRTVFELENDPLARDCGCTLDRLSDLIAQKVRKPCATRPVDAARNDCRDRRVNGEAYRVETQLKVVLNELNRRQVSASNALCGVGHTRSAVITSLRGLSKSENSISRARTTTLILLPLLPPLPDRLPEPLAVTRPPAIG